MNENESKIEAKGKSHVGTVAAAILSVIIVTYLFFPVVLFIPAFAVYHGKRGPVPRFYVHIMKPLYALEDRCPIYESLIEREFGLVEKYFRVNPDVFFG